MGNASRRIIITKRHEYYLKSPTNGVEINKAIGWALADMPEKLRGADNSVTIEPRDDEVVIYWEEKIKERADDER